MQHRVNKLGDPFLIVAARPSRAQLSVQASQAQSGGDAGATS